MVAIILLAHCLNGHFFLVVLSSSISYTQPVEWYGLQYILTYHSYIIGGASACASVHVATVRSSKLRFAIDEYTVRAIYTGHV